jgi:D-lactate dehydrogenase (cytochrome)
MSAVLARLAAIVGSEALLTAEADIAPHITDWRKRYVGRPLAVVKPASTGEVAAIVKLCAETRTPIVPQGGNTGLVGGATPDASGRELVLSLARLNRVRATDLANNTLTVEAGCTLASVQAAARDAGRLFPLRLASEGSCQIGGNLASNAGGTAVLRYGNARELVLGLEVVLPDGAVWDGLRGLRKDNTGYDLKQLFIGAEGTLGIITAAVLELFPLPAGRVTALAAIDTPAQAVALLGLLQARCGERLVGFELFSDFALGLVLKHYPASVAPFRERHPQYVLVELEDTQDARAVRALAEASLAAAIEAGLARDVALAESDAQANALWALRENMSEAQTAEGKNIKHDVSVPVSRIAAFIEATDAALARAFPGVRMVTFGHVGDGNLHYNAAAPEGIDPDAWMQNLPAVNRIVHDSVASFGGSISAEHGLGQSKRDEILRYKSAVEMDLMRKVKAAIDPLGIMNPGKVI